MEVVIGEGGTLTIPEEILKGARLCAGTSVSLRLSEDGEIVIQPRERDPEQAWFWTEEWQAGERRVDEDLKAGRTRVFLSDEEFVEEFERLANLP